MTIKILVLEGCERCQNFKKILDLNLIRYELMPCEKYPEQCDGIEFATGTSTYPIVLLANSKNEVLEVVYQAEKYMQLMEGRKTELGISYIPLHSIDNIVNYVVNKLKLKK